MDLTLALLKPHVVKQPHVRNAIRALILANNFKIVQWRGVQFDTKMAEKFYASHAGKFFYNRLITSITSDPLEAYILYSDDAIKRWRALIGPTQVTRAQYDQPQSIRGLYGLSDTRNAVHGSDSPVSVRDECAVIFPTFNVNEWNVTKRIYFARNQIQFNEGKFLHEMCHDKEATS